MLILLQNCVTISCKNYQNEVTYYYTTQSQWLSTRIKYPI